MSWIKAHRSIATNRKILRAAETLNLSVPAVMGHMILIWLWAIENAPNGEIDASAELIARIAQVPKYGRGFVGVLVQAGLLTEIGENRFGVVNYDEHIQPIISASKKHRVAQAEYERKQRSAESRKKIAALCDPAVDPDCHLLHA